MSCRTNLYLSLAHLPLFFISYVIAIAFGSFHLLIDKRRGRSAVNCSINLDTLSIQLLQLSFVIKMAASVFRQGLFTSKSGIVTGGGTGIGKAIARELLSLGANVIIASRKVDVLEATAEELRTELKLQGNKCEVFKCNIRDEADVKSLFQFAVERFGKVDFLVNNGGGQFPSPAENISANGWRTVIDLNLNGTFLCCKEAFNTGMDKHGGAIVNIVCEMNSGFPGMSHTGAARAGVVNMTKTLAVEWAPHNVRVNCVAPGVIFNDSAKEHYKNATEVPDMLEQGVEATPARRLGTVEEVSSAVSFLLSPGASYVTGINMDVGGGSHLTPVPFTLKNRTYPAWPLPKM